MKAKISVTNLFVGFAVLILFEPNIFYKIPILNYIYFFLMIVVGIILFMKSRIKIYLPILFLVFNRTVLLCSTIANHGDVSKAIYYSLNFIILFYLIDYSSRINKFYYCIEIIQKVFCMYLFINLVLFLIFPNGFVDNMFFLGYRTRFTDYAFVSIVVSLFNYQHNRNKHRLVTSICLSLLNLFGKWIATGIAGVLIFVILMFLYKLVIKKIAGFSFSLLYIGGFTITALFVVFRIQNIFSWFIENVLHRNTTLTYRTYLWDSCWPIINNNLFIGQGLTVNNGNIIWNGWTYTQAHNQILQSLLESGLIGTVFLLLFMYFCGKKLQMVDKSAYILGAGIATLIIIMTAEIYLYYAPAYLLFFIAFVYSKNANKADFEKSIYLTGDI